MTSSSPTIPSRQIPTGKQQQQQQFQDVLLLILQMGSFLFVDCLWINTFIREGLGMAAAAAASVQGLQALGVTSISLPGTDGVVSGRLVGSPSRSGGTRAEDPPVADLVAKESIIATWHLQTN
jgi:hypothetical protein